MTLTYDSPPDEVGDVLIAECLARGYTRDMCIAVDSTGRQESGLRMVWSRNRLWFGYFQQDGGYPNRMDPLGNMRGFLDRLDRQLAKPGASPDIWKNIFWLQQGPNHPSADHAYAVGRQEYLTEIQSEVSAATRDYDRVAPQSGGTQVGLRGDPVWLPDVLRAEGLRCDIFPGAFDRGHGDFGDIWGVVVHHTGSFGETPNGIANHPSLGLASQLFLSRDGTYTLCGVGIAWHAGNGSWPGLGTNNANPRTIGIEAQNDGGGTPGKPHHIPWSDVQYDAYVRGCAAICRKLGEDSSHVIGHKDWAGPAQGKWDPGGIDMNIMRSDIQRRIFPAQPGQTLNAIDEQAKVATWLGKRLTPEQPTVDGKGRFAEFEQGHIYWSPDTGAWAIPKNLFEAYAELGWETGLGYPVRAHAVLDGSGDVQAFQRGVLYRKYGEAGHFITGAIGNRYAIAGYESGALGWPTTNEQKQGTLVWQGFEGGRIAWSPDGTVVIDKNGALS